MYVLLFLHQMQKGGCVTLSPTILYLHREDTEDSCYQNEAQERKSPRALEQLVRLNPHLSIYKWLHIKLFPSLNPPCQQPEAAPNEHRSPMAPPFSINTWLEIRITFTSVLRCHSHTGMLNHISRVEWSQFSSATRLSAFFTSLKGAQVIILVHSNHFTFCNYIGNFLNRRKGRIKCPAFLDVLQTFWCLRKQELLNHTSQICYQEIHPVQSWVCWLKCLAG